MTEYHKINSLYKRSEDGKRMLFGEYSCPEFEFLKDCQWRFTEKVDGANIRIIVKDGSVVFGGKTDAAQIPAKLVERLAALFGEPTGKAALLAKVPDGVLYGEGHGAGIQKGGGNYSKEQEFVLFDVLTFDREGGRQWWLKRHDVKDVADFLGLTTVPDIGNGTLTDLEQRVQSGITSQWGRFQAEGIVARPAVELQARSGSRIITKLKTRDFH